MAQKLRDTSRPPAGPIPSGTALFPPDCLWHVKRLVHRTDTALWEFQTDPLGCVPVAM